MACSAVAPGSSLVCLLHVLWVSERGMWQIHLLHGESRDSLTDSEPAVIFIRTQKSCDPGKIHPSTGLALRLSFAVFQVCFRAGGGSVVTNAYSCRGQVWFSTPMSDGSRPPVTSASLHLTLYFGLRMHVCNKSIFKVMFYMWT